MGEHVQEEVLQSMNQDIHTMYFPTLEEIQDEMNFASHATRSMIPGTIDVQHEELFQYHQENIQQNTLQHELAEQSSDNYQLIGSDLSIFMNNHDGVNESSTLVMDETNIKKRRLDSSPIVMTTTISLQDTDNTTAWQNQYPTNYGLYSNNNDNGNHPVQSVKKRRSDCVTSTSADSSDDEDGDEFGEDEQEEEEEDGVELDNLSSFSSSDGSKSSVDHVIPLSLITRNKTRRGKVPRLIKHDIRRYYGRMLYNVMNSHDRSLIMQWFQTFAVTSMKFLRLEDLGRMVYTTVTDAEQWEHNKLAHFPDFDDHMNEYHHRRKSSRDEHTEAANNGHNHNVILGRNSIVTYLLLVQRQIPDLVTQLMHDTYQILRWKERKSSQIVFQATYSGTTFEYEPLLSATKTQQHHANNNNTTSTTSTNTMRRISHVVHFTIVLETTLYLNDEMLLYRWESKTLHFDSKRVPFINTHHNK